MANDQPKKKPLGASASQPLTPHQEELRDAFLDSLASLKEQLGAETDEELCAVLDKRYPGLAPN